jgi:hypothetical protein
MDSTVDALGYFPDCHRYDAARLRAHTVPAQSLKGVNRQMETNPYSPPRAPVADISSDRTMVNRDVLIACKLFWLMFGLTLAGTVFEVLRQLSIAPMIGNLIVATMRIVVAFAFTWWTVSKLKLGRNWMRLLLTISTVLGYLCVPIFWKFYLPIYARNPIMAGVNVLQIIPSVWAIVLLNLPRSRSWFSPTTGRKLSVA